MSNEQRTALYGATAAGLGVWAAFGGVNAEQQEAVLAAVGHGLTALVAVFAAVKTWKQRPAAEKKPAE